MKKEKILYERIFEKLEGLFDKVIYEKSRGYESNPKPGIGDVDQIIKHYSSKCAMISLGAALKPGQMAVKSAVPEIVLGMKKQSEMIFDISAAYGKDDIMSREMLAGILFTGVTGSSYGLLEFKNDGYTIYENQKLFDNALYKTAKKISRMMFRSSFVRWLPGFSTVSSVLISGEVTRKIGTTTCDILSKGIEVNRINDDLSSTGGEAMSVSKEGNLVGY